MGEKNNEINRTRRTVLKGLGVASIAGGFAGCLGGGGGGGGGDGGDGNNTQDSAGNEHTKIKFWTTQVESKRQQVIKSLIQNYESAQNPSVKMIPVAENDLPTQISTARASRTFPTVGEFGLAPMRQLGSAGLLSREAADAVIENIGKEKFYEGPLQLTQAPKGGHFAVPMHGWVQGFWYRKSVLEEHGLDTPTTWDTLLEAAKTLHKPDQNQYGIVVGTKKAAYARQCFTPFALSNGAQVFNKEGEIVFDSEAMIEALDYYAKLSQYTPPGADTWKTANHTYLNKQCHLIEYSSYIMGDIADQSTEMINNTGFASYIEKKKRSSFGQIVCLNLFSTSTEAKLQAGKDFSTFLMTGDHYIKWLHMAPGGMFPVLKPVAKSEEWRNAPVLKVWGGTLIDVSNAFANIDRFGVVDGQSFPALGRITGEFLIAEAVARVTSGEDPSKVAAEVAEQMREAVKK